VAALALAGTTALILPTHTPGARYSKVTQATIKSTICKSGWTKTIRPAGELYECAQEGAAGALELRRPEPLPLRGGPPDLARASAARPRSHRNLWPEPWSQAHKSDPRENAWHKKVCNGTLTLRQARAQELAYERKHGQAPDQ
jgi:hypothetical protein